MLPNVIWIHTQAEPDFDLHLEMAGRGAWLEYDSIGNPEWRTDEYLVEHIQRVLDAGFGDHLLLSHDRGWFDPALPGGGIPKPYLIYRSISPKLRAGWRGRVHQLTHVNPFRHLPVEIMKLKNAITGCARHRSWKRAG
jgi:phosphotriesterase-related protein